MARRRLGAELKALRQGQESTLEEVALAMDWSLSKTIRIERAARISTNDLKALLHHYRLTNEKVAEELLALAREARRTLHDDHNYDVPREILELIDCESAASNISQFESTFIPGILQTEEYALTVLQYFCGKTSAPEHVAHLVDLRLSRRDLLTIEDAPHFSFIIDEAAILRPVGSPAIMSWQLEHLVTVAELPNVSIRVTPYSAGLHPGIRSSFEVVDQFGYNKVFIEHSCGDILVADPQQTMAYIATFDRIDEVSLGPSRSASRLLQAIDEITEEPS
jgi:hypothetical protein